MSLETKGEEICILESRYNRYRLYSLLINHGHEVALFGNDEELYSHLRTGGGVSASIVPFACSELDIYNNRSQQIIQKLKQLGDFPVLVSYAIPDQYARSVLGGLAVQLLRLNFDSPKEIIDQIARAMEKRPSGVLVPH